MIGRGEPVAMPGAKLKVWVYEDMENEFLLYNLEADKIAELSPKHNVMLRKKKRKAG
jgi:hypothetical protein